MTQPDLAVPAEAMTAGPVRHARPDAARHSSRYHPVVRITHWISTIAIFVMIGSGLRIFNASPAFARKGERIGFWPWEGQAIPANLTFGGWLGGARHWHFAMMWVLVVNALVYLAFIFLHGDWRDLAPVRGDVRDAWEMVKFYMFVRKRHPHQGKHNALQKTAYVSMLVSGALLVTTGLAIWKPVSLGWLTNLMGGYALARWWHFLAMLILTSLIFMHIFMVFAVDPYAIRAMTTGGYDASRFSPEARNARPFVHLAPAMPRQSDAGAGDMAVTDARGIHSADEETRP
jgi:Ni/Fe-hydrogenase b-type cytochrome subunit